jgi:type III pantothenate kinase
MTLAIDIGNTNIVIALYKNEAWTNTFRYETKEVQPPFFYETALRNILLEWGVAYSEVNNTVISSVVPDLNDVITDAVRYVTGYEPLRISPDVMKNLDMPVPRPYEIGSDLVSNAYAVVKKYKTDAVIVDFGTALTFTVVTREGGIRGVTIAPGLKTAIGSLSDNTALLPTVPLDMPVSAIGQDTITAIQSGVMWGYVGLVKELVSRIRMEMQTDLKVVATGGLSSVLEPLSTVFDITDKMLTLEGMRLISVYTGKK